MNTNISDAVVAIVPMRHHSERVPGKNYRPFAGRPLYHRILEVLSNSRFLGRIVVDTDSPRIKRGVRKAFPDITVIDRPEDLRGGKVSMNDVLCNVVHQVPVQLYMQTHATSPLVTTATVDRAIDCFLNQNEHDSLFSVTRLQTRLYDQDGEAMNHDPNNLIRTQDLPPVYEENSAFYVFPRDCIMSTGRRIGRNPLMFEISPVEATDIDEEMDFKIAEFLYRNRERNKTEA